MYGNVSENQAHNQRQHTQIMWQKKNTWDLIL